MSSFSFSLLSILLFSSTPQVSLFQTRIRHDLARSSIMPAVTSGVLSPPTATHGPLQHPFH